MQFKIKYFFNKFLLISFNVRLDIFKSHLLNLLYRFYLLALFEN